MKGAMFMSNYIVQLVSNVIFNKTMYFSATYNSFFN